MNKQYEYKILSWTKEDFHALVASMSQEDIRSMVRKLYDETFDATLDAASPDHIVYSYILFMAYEAETAQNDRDAEILYSILDAYEQTT